MGETRGQRDVKKSCHVELLLNTLNGYKPKLILWLISPKRLKFKTVYKRLIFSSYT